MFMVPLSHFFFHAYSDKVKCLQNFEECLFMKQKYVIVGLDELFVCHLPLVGQP